MAEGARKGWIRDANEGKGRVTKRKKVELRDGKGGKGRERQKREKVEDTIREREGRACMKVKSKGGI